MKEYILYHKSEDRKFLVEVKRYHYLAYTTRWVRRHEGAQVYMLANMHGLPPVWHKPSGAWWWERLTKSEVAALPERLDSK